MGSKLGSKVGRKDLSPKWSQDVPEIDPKSDGSLSLDQTGSGPSYQDHVAKRRSVGKAHPDLLEDQKELKPMVSRRSSLFFLTSATTR